MARRVQLNRRRGDGGLPVSNLTGVAVRLLAFVVIYALVTYITFDLTSQEYYRTSMTQLKINEEKPPLEGVTPLQTPLSPILPGWGARRVPHEQQKFLHRDYSTCQGAVKQTKNETLSRPTPTALLDHDTIRNHLLAEAPWAESHGADHMTFLGAGLLYYSFAYAFQSKTIVVLGSGGGFVPRMLKQAQRDLELAGRPGPFETILIDAHIASAGWGSTFYAENNQTVMRTLFNDIDYVFNLTDNAINILNGTVSIDYLHVDADHSFEQSFRDFENFFALLSPRGVVSFHDTCYDVERQCQTGVPQTVAKIKTLLDEYGLQLIDAHYLYRGIAFAIRQDAPALETPKERRFNFCKNNAQALHKTSSGFSMNARRGSLSTLGDFYECDKRFNTTALGRPCPEGRRRDHKGGCSLCVPGMRGDHCQEFVYEALRSIEKSNKTGSLRDTTNQQRLVAAYMAERRSQHIFEVGGSTQPISSQYFHAAMSFWSVDPLMEYPRWSEDETPVIRWLPLRIGDVLAANGHYASLMEDVAGSIDTLVCLDCESQITNVARLNILFEVFPRLETMALSYSHGASGMVDQILDQMDASWVVESDLVMGNQLEKEDEPRRIIFVTKQ